MALGYFAKGFSEGFISAYSAKKEKERQEELLNKSFLLEEKKKRAELEAQANKYHDTAVGLQEAYGLTPNQTNTIYFNLQSGIMDPEKVQELAQKYSVQNSRPSKEEATAPTAPAVPEKLEAPKPMGGLEEQTKDLLRGGPQQTTPSVEGVEGVGDTSLTRSYSPAPTLTQELGSAGFSGKLYSYIRPDITDPTQVFRFDRTAKVDDTNKDLFRFANDLRNNGELNFSEDPEREERLLKAIELNQTKVGLLRDYGSGEDADFAAAARGAAQTLLEDPLVRSKWINHVVQREYNGFVEEGDSDNVARTKALISVTAGQEYASAWDGTGKGLNSLLGTLQQVEGQGEYDFLSTPAHVRLSSALTEGRQLGQIPTIEQLDSEKDKQNSVTRSGPARSQAEAAKTAETRLRAEVSYDSFSSNVALSSAEAPQTGGLGTSTSAPTSTIIPNSPSKVGYRTLTGTGMPYAEAGLARMPQLVSSITSLDLSTFDNMNVATIKAAIRNEEAYAEYYKRNGQSEKAQQAVMNAATLQILLEERTPDPMAFLNEPFVGNDPKELADIRFQLQDFIASPDTSDSDRKTAEQKLDQINRYSLYSNSETFDYDSFVEDPVTYGEYLQETNPALYKRTENLFKKKAGTDLLKGVDFSKFNGTQHLSMLELYSQVAKEQLEALPEDDVAGRQKARFNIELITATAKGIINANPKQFTEETLVSEGIVKYGRLKDADNAWQQSVRDEDPPEVQQKKLQALEQARQDYAAHKDILEERSLLQKLVNPDANTTGIDQYATDIGSFVRAEEMLRNATTPEEEAAARRVLQTQMAIQEVRRQRLLEGSRIRAQAEAELRGGQFAVGPDNKVRLYSQDEINSLNLRGTVIPTEFVADVQKAKAQDIKRTTEAENAREAALSTASVASRVSSIVDKNPYVLTDTARMVSFLEKVRTEAQTAGRLLGKQEVIDMAEQENLLIPAGKGLSDARNQFKASLIELGFTAGQGEGTSGNAMSNQDYNNLMSMISAGGTRSPQVFISSLNSYVEQKISEANSKVQGTRGQGAVLYTTVSNYVPSKEARDNYLKENTPPNFYEYIDKPENQNDVRVKNYRTLVELAQKNRVTQNAQGAQSSTRGLGAPPIEGQADVNTYIPALERAIQEAKFSGSDDPIARRNIAQTLDKQFRYTAEQLKKYPEARDRIEALLFMELNMYGTLPETTVRNLLDSYSANPANNQ